MSILMTIQRSGILKQFRRGLRRLRFLHVFLALLAIAFCAHLRNTLEFWSGSETEAVLQSFQSRQQKEEKVEANIEVEGAVLKTTSTDPSFRIWLYPPKKDIISRKIAHYGFYEAEEIKFTDMVVASTTTSSSTTTAGWAVDIGANIGFHTLYMAAIGMNVIAFEPALDTASLLRKSIETNGFDAQHHVSNSGPRVHVVRAAAGETNGRGRLIRRPGSAGMTMLQPYDDNDGQERSDPLPFGIEEVVGVNIEIVRPEEILEGILSKSSTTTDKQQLRLLKVDAEGHELHALRGVNLVKFPFKFLAFEFFPELLQQAGGTDPLELLLFVATFGYACATEPSLLEKIGSKSLSLSENAKKSTNGNRDDAGILMETADDFRLWYETHAAPSHKKEMSYHTNLYCKQGN